MSVMIHVINSVSEGPGRDVKHRHVREVVRNKLWHVGVGVRILSKLLS